MAQPGRDARSPFAAPAAATAALFLLLAADVGAARFYRWVDENGDVHYTDHMPAAAADEEHSVMDASGIVMEHRESSAVEREQRRRDKAAAAGQRRRIEQEQKQAEEQQRRDRVILQTFVAERDIRITRDSRVEAVQVQINIVEHGITRLENQRAGLERQLEGMPEDAPAAKSLRDRVVVLDTRLEQRRRDRSRLEDRREETERRFTRYLERFRELRADREQASPDRSLTRPVSSIVTQEP